MGALASMPSEAIPERSLRRLKRSDVWLDEFLSIIGRGFIPLKASPGDGGFQIFRSVNTGVKYFHSSKNAAGRLYGWHSMIARKALSW